MNESNWPYWQDMERTIPANKGGDPVAVCVQKDGTMLTQPDPDKRPILADYRGSLILEVMKFANYSPKQCTELDTLGRQRRKG